MKLAYFVHDLNDPAVARRVRMLRAGGADPVVLGFYRGDAPPSLVGGARAIDLGRTYDGRLGHRARATLRVALRVGRLRDVLEGAEVVLARSLEMLLVAVAARRLCDISAGVVYECLDIHRVMLRRNLVSRAMRALERALLRRCRLLVVSSPAFTREYFEALQGLSPGVGPPVLLLENKVLELDGPAPRPAQRRSAARPWRIAWLGAIRCRHSLDILADLADRRPDLVEVRIHGRPAYSEFANFAAQTSQTPNLVFGGAYVAEDLPQLYGDADFCWAIDYMEEGQNSAWLLPNRVYESSRFGATPIALEGVETGRFLEARGFGVRLADAGGIEAFLDQLTPEAYANLRENLESAPSRDFYADRSDCLALVRALAGPPADEASNPDRKRNHKPIQELLPTGRSSSSESFGNRGFSGTCKTPSRT